MADDEIRYDRMVETALRGVVRDALTLAATRGLPGDHHFFVTFKTGHPSVRIPGHLRAQYADEMTIVLQYQFIQLEVDETGFSVTLSFSNKHERLRIPYSAITSFADPSVNFALQFQSLSDEDMEPVEGSGLSGETVTPLAPVGADGTIQRGGQNAGDKGLTDQSASASRDGEPRNGDPGNSDEGRGDDPGGDDGANGGNKVVTLDRFRKK